MRNLARPAMLRRTAPTAWNVQPLQQHFAEGDPADPPADPADPPSDPPADPTDPPTDPDKEPAEVDWKKESRKHEAEAKKNRAAAAELDKLKAKSRSAEENAQKERDDARAEAEAAKAEAARERAARKYGLSDADLEFLDGVPADKFDARAKALSDRLKSTTPPGKGTTPVNGDRSDKPKPTTLSGVINAHYSK